VCSNLPIFPSPDVPCVGCQHDGITADDAGNGCACLEYAGAGRRRGEGSRGEGVGGRRGWQKAGGATATAEHGRGESWDGDDDKKHGNERRRTEEEQEGPSSWSDV